jgi:hypothetical protein
LIINGSNDRQWYIRKNNLLPFTAKLIADAQLLVKQAISDRWKSALLDYRTEAAMDNDDIFERLVQKLTASLAPDLLEILKNPKLFLVFDELLRSHDAIPKEYKIFGNTTLLPLPVLFSLQRKEILADVKFMLPFWYSIPIIVAVIAFFKNLKRKKAEKETWEEETGKAAPETGKEREVQSAAQELASSLTPEGYTLDNYLKELEENWGKLIKRNDSAFVTNVNALIRDRLRQFMRTQKNDRVTTAFLNQAANSIIDENKALKGLNDRESLYYYVRLYILKLMITKKV